MSREYLSRLGVFLLFFLESSEEDEEELPPTGPRRESDGDSRPADSEPGRDFSPPSSRTMRQGILLPSLMMALKMWIGSTRTAR